MPLQAITDTLDLHVNVSALTAGDHSELELETLKINVVRKIGTLLASSDSDRQQQPVLDAHPEPEVTPPRKRLRVEEKILGPESLTLHSRECVAREDTGPSTSIGGKPWRARKSWLSDARLPMSER